MSKDERDAIIEALITRRGCVYLIRDGFYYQVVLQWR